MLAQIATLVCAAAMALSLVVEVGSFFHSSPRTTAESGALDGVADPGPAKPGRSAGPERPWAG